MRRGYVLVSVPHGTLPTVEREYRDELPIEHVHGHPRNVRTDLGDLRELVASIREIGILEPLVVAPDDTTSGYVAIAGNRRRAAAVIAGLRVVPAIIRTGLTEQQVYQAMLVENLHRVGLTPIEEAVALKGLRDSGLTLMQIAQKIGKSDAFVHDRLILNELPDELRQKVINKELRVTSAVKMARLLAGRSPDKLDRGWDTPHFAKSHPLWPLAYSRCQELEHGLRRRIVGACGACWEQTIREDQRRQGSVLLVTDDDTAPRTDREPLPAGYHPRVAWGEDRGALVTRAADLAELNALAGGVRETVMTATPARIRRLLDRAFRRLTESVERQQAQDERERRTLTQAVADLTDVFEDDDTREVAGAAG